MWWLIAIVLIVFEAITFDLCTIWFAVGALAAGLVGIVTDNLVVQLTAFIVVSVLCLAFTKPLVDRFLKSKQVKTNVASLVGERARVVGTINNSLEQGAVFINGLEWTARSIDDSIIEKDELVTVLKIDGVKLIVQQEERTDES